MKKIFHLSFAILIVFSISCKTKKEIMSGTLPLQSSSETVRLPEIEFEDKAKSAGAMEEIKVMAEKMAAMYCEKEVANQKYKDSEGNELEQKNIRVHIENLEQQMADYQKQIEPFISSDFQKQEFDRIYSGLIKECG
jgi:hypothetical protein